MDNAARAHSVNTPLGIEAVVMVGVVAACDTIVVGIVGGRALGPCSAVSMTIPRAADSVMGSSGFASMEWLHRQGISGMSSLLDRMSLESFMLSSIGASVQFVPHGRVQPSVGLLHFEHLGSCVGSVYAMESMLT